MTAIAGLALTEEPLVNAVGCYITTDGPSAVLAIQANYLDCPRTWLAEGESAFDGLTRLLGDYGLKLGSNARLRSRPDGWITADDLVMSAGPKPHALIFRVEAERESLPAIIRGAVVVAKANLQRADSRRHLYMFPGDKIMTLSALRRVKRSFAR
ncbi:MAG TPA: hypothetical protein VLI05_03525 [Candidatus Saccharimonadia bacterium]|nr:hypothetical protein [Candidatus Saccharimonadia bacterium]